MSATVLEKLSQAEQQAAAAAAEAYADLVIQLASGTDDPELTDVQAVLKASGKTASDLREDVGRRQRRDELRRKIGAADDAVAERPEIDRKLEAAKRELEAAEQKYRETVFPLNNRIAEINQLSIDRMMAETELVRGCDDEAVLARERGVQTELQNLNNQARQLRDLITRVDSQRSVEAMGRNVSSENLKVYEDRKASHQKTLGETQAKIEALQAESLEIKQQKMES